MVLGSNGAVVDSTACLTPDAPLGSSLPRPSSDESSDTCPVWSVDSPVGSDPLSGVTPPSGNPTHTTACALGAGRSLTAPAAVGRAGGAGPSSPVRADVALVPSPLAPASARSARPEALNAARHCLRQSATPTLARLADADDTALLVGLGVVGEDGLLTPTGRLAFAGRGAPCLEYVRRTSDQAGSVMRLRWRERSLLEELACTLETLESAERGRGLEPAASGTASSPGRSARQAIVNALIHRDWTDAAPTRVEHLDDTVLVTSPGGVVDAATEPAQLSDSTQATRPGPSLDSELADLFAMLALPTAPVAHR